MPSSSRSCTSSKLPPSFLLSLFPFRVALARPHEVPFSIPSAPFLAALPHANVRTKRNCSRGPSGPHPRASRFLGPLVPSSRSLFVYLAKFDSPTRSDLTSRSLLVPRLSPPHRAPPSCHRWFPLGIHLLSSLSFSRSADGNARRLPHLASHFHWREVVVVGFFSQHPAFRLASGLNGR